MFNKCILHTRIQHKLGHIRKNDTEVPGSMTKQSNSKQREDNKCHNLGGPGQWERVPNLASGGRWDPQGFGDKVKVEQELGAGR